MNPWYSLEKKAIWVIGGAGYFGSAITEEIDPLCAKTLCIDLPGKAAALIRQRKLTRAIPADLDVFDTDRLEANLEELIARHGVPDGVVYLPAGSSAGKYLGELSKEEFRKTFDNALTPVFLGCRLLAERMKPRGSGSVVLYASMYGIVSPDPRIYKFPNKPNPIDYGAGKAALLQMNRYLAVHYAPAGIRFNAIVPGPFPHPGVQKQYPDFMKDLGAKNPMGRIGRNTEVVGPTLLFLTDSASYVTGQCLSVDGGWTIW
jgi:NAD(P)-dependent dehydrogenase (short-subunit alcohol dehydrogenase family)